MKIAVLGAGFQGVCVAAELASRGYNVDLYDREPLPLTQAGLANEGKIHLGFVYANDPTCKTARRMMEGALRFSDILKKWLAFDAGRIVKSRPFYYGIHAETDLPEAGIISYFDKIKETYRELSDSPGAQYLDIDPGRFCEKLTREEFSEMFNDNRLLSAFRTMEKSVDATSLALYLRDYISHSQRINFINNTEIKKVHLPGSDTVSISVYQDGRLHRGEYNQVINTLWTGRLAIDSTAGIRPRRKWLYRYKMGIEFEYGEDLPQIPSLTLVHGPFGDIVNYNDRKFYISWYPDCLVGKSGDIVPEDFGASLCEAEKHRIFKRSFAALSEICPKLADIALEKVVSVLFKAGYIFAWGETDIHDMNSELHCRYDIGIHSSGNYHSIDTGKYTMAPLFAEEVCNRIAGRN